LSIAQEELGSTQQALVEKIRQNEEKFLHLYLYSPYDYPPDYIVTESTISIVSEIQGGRDLFFSLGISKDFYNHFRRGVSTGNNFMLGVEYNPFATIWAPKVSVGGNAFILNYRLNVLYYISDLGNQLAFRPEVGFGLYRVQFSFGRNIFLQNEITGNINKWNASLYWFYNFLPRFSPEKNR
jgi:hypothetical protein